MNDQMTKEQEKHFAKLVLCAVCPEVKTCDLKNCSFTKEKRERAMQILIDDLNKSEEDIFNEE